MSDPFWGRRLQTMLDRLGWSQGALADILGVNRRRISRVAHQRERAPEQVEAWWRELEPVAEQLDKVQKAAPSGRGRWERTPGEGE